MYNCIEQVNRMELSIVLYFHRVFYCRAPSDWMFHFINYIKWLTW